MDFDHFVTTACEALDGLCTFLSWHELQSLVLSGSVAFRSRLRWQWIHRTRIVLPPNAHACAAVCQSAAFTDVYVPAVCCVTIGHTNCLSAEPCAWLALVEQLTIDPDRFQLPPELSPPAIDLTTVVAVMPHLHELNLSSIKSFSDTTPLAQLTSLRRLDLSSTTVEDLTPLRNLQRLHYLDIANTNVMDLEPLRSLPDLQTIALDVNPVSCARLVPIITWSRPPTLRVTSVRGSGIMECLETQLVHVAPFMTQFTCHGFAMQWRTSIAQFLTAMHNIEILAIPSVVVLESIGSLTHLRELYLSTLHYNDISALATLNMLEKVSLVSGKCIELAPLANLPRLWYLYCHGGDPDSMNQDGADIELRALRVLNVSNHYLHRLCRLDCLDELSVYVWSGDSLMLPSNRAQDISHLRLNGDVNLQEIHRRFPRLRSLELQQCASYRADDLSLFMNLESLTLLDPLSKLVLPRTPMSQLRKLCLRGPNITIMSKNILQTVSNLRELDLEKTKISDISQLPILQKLNVLNLKDTSVQDVSPLLLIPNLVKVILPKRAQCTPLVSAYHDAQNRLSLREVLHPTKNCLWGSHKRQHRPSRPKQNDDTHDFQPPEPVVVSYLEETLNRCSVT